MRPACDIPFRTFRAFNGLRAGAFKLGQRGSGGRSKFKRTVGRACSRAHRGGSLAATWTMPLASGIRGPTVVTVKGASIPGARLISQPGASHGATDSDATTQRRDDVTVMVQVSGVCNVNSEPRYASGSYIRLTEVGRVPA
jgi:hypothetical protein